MSNIIIRILGTAAGGGLPQLNCFCENCRLARNNEIPRRTQDSLAISVNNGKSWNIINVSSDIRDQINNLNIKANCNRQKIIDRVFLTDAHLDHTLGLLLLRECKEFDIHCENNVKNELKPILNMLEKYSKLTFKTLNYQFNNCKIEKVYVKGKPPPFSINRNNQQLGDNVALKIINIDNNKYIFYCPCILEISDNVRNIILNSVITLIDGTVYNDKEMVEMNGKTGKDMGHISNEEIISDSVLFNKILFTHINNSNPICRDPNLVYNKIAEELTEIII